MNEILENAVFEKYLKIVMNLNFKGYSFRNSKFNFRCNVCGDSKKSSTKKRGWITLWKKKWNFKCFNCSSSFSAYAWMKKYYPVVFRDYLREVYSQNSTKIIEPTVEKPIEKKETVIQKNFRNFIPILNQRAISDKAVQFCIDRKIPKNIYKKWFVCEEGFYRNRLIIPFYDKEEHIYFWQARSLIGKEPKYLNSLFSKEDVIYNWDFIDKDKEIIVLEGVIDSLFVENSIAVLSTVWDWKIDKKLNALNCYYLLDYDQSKETKRRYLKLLKEKRKIFNWVKLIKDINLPPKDKWDINELIMYKNINKKLSYSNLKKYFTNDFYDSVYFL